MPNGQGTVPSHLFQELYEQYLAMIATYPPGFGIPSFEQWLQTRMTGVKKLPPEPTPEALSPIEQQIRSYEEAKAAAEAAAEGEAGGEPTEGGYKVPLPSGMPQQYTNQYGQVMYWDENRGDYIQIGFDPEGVYQPDPTMPQWRPGELELQRQQFGATQDWRRMQMMEAAAARRGEASLRREEMIAGLTGPRDWIKYWETTEGPGSIKFRMQNLHSEAMSHLQASKGLTGNERLREEVAAEKLFDKYSALAKEAGTMPTTPPTPSWLPQHLIPGVSRRGGVGEIPMAGEPAERLAVRTPSPQQYTAMPETAKLGLAGYADWSTETGKVPGARSWLDVLGHMEQMMPTYSPGARWRPARQRA